MGAAGVLHRTQMLVRATALPERSRLGRAGDREITSRLEQALDLVGIRVLDHLVIGETITSFAGVSIGLSTPRGDSRAERRWVPGRRARRRSDLKLWALAH